MGVKIMERKLRILHIEDNEMFSETLECILDSFEFKNSCFGGEALILLSNEKFDMILCDGNLPDMSGIYLIRKIRTFSDIPIIANSGNEDNNIEMLKGGANCYITKCSTNIKEYYEIIISCHKSKIKDGITL